VTGRDHLYHEDARTLNTYVLPNESGRIGRNQLPQIQTVPNRSAWLAGNGGYPEIGPNVAKPRRTASELEAEFQVRSGARSRSPPPSRLLL
jgi:hypothetical protein